jgi:TPP-dependent pyruvate/acetoin dehydrogenase alpha subunit
MPDRVLAPAAASACPADGCACRLPDADLELLLLIRHFELAVLSLFADGKITGTTHACLGQEYIPVAVTPLLSSGFIVSNHRSHGHYLARFWDPAGLLAEIAGRAGGICGGVGGSQHLHRDGFFSTGVQGEGVAMAAGMALHLVGRSPSALAAVYIGDGTWGQGVVYEALNMAALWRLPLLVLVENNGIAQSTPTHRAMSGSVAGRAAAFGVRYEEVVSACPLSIRRQLAGPVSDVRDGGGPLIAEFRTQRLGPHSKGDDHRDPGQLAGIREKDWYARYRRCHPDHFAAADLAARQRVADLCQDVLAQPLADGPAWS